MYRENCTYYFPETEGENGDEARQLLKIFIKNPREIRKKTMGLCNLIGDSEGGDTKQVQIKHRKM